MLEIFDNFLQLFNRLFVERGLDVKLVDAESVFERGWIDLFFDESREDLARDDVGGKPHIEIMSKSLDAHVRRRDFGDSLNDGRVSRNDNSTPEEVEILDDAP